MYLLCTSMKQTIIDVITFNCCAEFVLQLLVEECKPKLTGMKDLVDELNLSNDFSRFVQNVRKEFCRLIRGN